MLAIAASPALRLLVCHSFPIYLFSLKVVILYKYIISWPQTIFIAVVLLARDSSLGGQPRRPVQRACQQGGPTSCLRILLQLRSWLDRSRLLLHPSCILSFASQRQTCGACMDCPWGGLYKISRASSKFPGQHLLPFFENLSSRILQALKQRNYQMNYG